MNYLIIGNGFDLAHGYKTRYQDFLYWVKQEINLYNSTEDSERIGIELVFNIDKSLLDKISTITKTHTYLQKEIWKLIDKNYWLEYFIYSEDKLQDGWTGFENEISMVIQQFDSIMRGRMGQRYTNPIDSSALAMLPKFIDLHSVKVPVSDGTEKDLSDDKLKEASVRKGYYIVEGLTSYKEMIERFSKDLSSLIRLFEIYLLYFSKRKVGKKRLPGLKNLRINRVISFNYTSTYSDLYDADCETDYIHGQASKDHKAETDNLVLGINEYLDDNRASKELEFIGFKKYYQRIRKRANSDYMSWIDNIRAISDKSNVKERDVLLGKIRANDSESPSDYINQVYIIGHSLDKNDADVLKGFIQNDNVRTTIYYFNDADYAQKVANLVQVLGKEDFIRRTAGNHQTIYFVDQSELM